MSYYCNPLNVNYRYQIPKKINETEQGPAWREAADPSMIYFKGSYYIFASMTLGVWVSKDLAHWVNHPLPEELPLYDYAPDVRVMGDYVYFCASRILKNCDRYRTKDILNGPYEKIPGNFSFWDPNLFIDEDGRVYFYWGCSNETPICGTELDPETMLPIGEKKNLIFGSPQERGYERVGEDNSVNAVSKESQPFIEGAWMDKHDGKYYLQYAFAGTEYNTYGDGVYVGDSPLGPFTPQKNNPYSYHPGGFMPGAGHGSTMEDAAGNLWHTATMRISLNHIFERRVGLWPAGYDKDGELYCNQRYGDWPGKITGDKKDPWEEPDWMLLSVGKRAGASSETEGHPASNAVCENVQNWWKPASDDSSPWLLLDLEKQYRVHGIQINFADDLLYLPCRDESKGITRFIEDRTYPTWWKLWGSKDGADWFVIEDKSAAETDFSHDFIVREEGVSLRYLKLTDMAVPYEQQPCISGIRVFGKGDGKKPEEPGFKAVRIGDLDMEVEILKEAGANRQDSRALGYEILWGHAPDKLYHSRTLYGEKVCIGALVKGEEYYVRVDAFNENGITHGSVRKLSI